MDSEILKESRPALPGRWYDRAEPLRGSEVMLRADYEDELLILDPEDTEVTLVQVSICQKGITTGRDRGALWIEDGLLYFVGRRCSFCLSAADLTGTIKQFDLASAMTLHAARCRLRLRQGADLWIGEVSTARARADWRDSSLPKRLRAFLALHEIPTHQERRTLPPLTLGRTEHPRTLLREALVKFGLLAVWAITWMRGGWIHPVVIIACSLTIAVTRYSVIRRRLGRIEAAHGAAHRTTADSV